MTRDEFIEELKKVGIVLSDKQLFQLNRFYELLCEWNEKINLTRIIEEKDVYLKHFYDSLTLSRVVDLSKNLSLCDVGTGAGFPGIVLKIVFPNLSITLIDALLKRVRFLNIVIEELGLSDICAVHMRGEDYAKNNKNKFDIVTSRAVSNLSSLSLICLPLVKNGGYFIPMKANCDDEIENAKKTILKMKGEIILIDKFVLPIESSNRTLIKIEKKH